MMESLKRTHDSDDDHKKIKSIKTDDKDHNKEDQQAGNDTTQENATFKFTASPSLEDIRHMQAVFVKERNWEQFHSPRNILLAMVGEVGELAELFQWRGEVQTGLPDWKIGERAELANELSDVLLYLVRLADRCHVDLPAAVLNKFEQNCQKYPVEKVYGSSKKYTHYQNSEKE